MESGPKREASLYTLTEVLEQQLELLVICLSHSWGGLEQVAARDVVEVGSLGLKTRVLVLSGTPIHRELKGRKEVRVETLESMPRDTLDLGLRTVLQNLVKDGVNLIHIHQPSLLGSIVPWIWQLPNVGLIATRHIMSSHHKTSFIHRTLYGRLDALLVVSETIRKNVLETHAIDPRKVKVVHLGLDFDRFDPDKVDAQARRASWGADKDTKLIGLVGRIDPAKGQSTFIRAAAGLLKSAADREKRKLKFVIVGAETLTGPEESQKTHLEGLQEMVAQFRLQDDVLFTGFQENVPEVMQAFDIFVMPSRQEAFGLVAIEAMAMECPVILSRGGSAEEIIQGSDAKKFGLVVKADDAFDLQQKIRFLLDHPEECIEMGKNARSHVVSNYDRKQRLRRSLEIYERVLRRRRSL